MIIRYDWGSLNRGDRGYEELQKVNHFELGANQCI